MSETVSDFRERKVADLIEERHPRTVRIVFRHGLGDALMFWRVCLPALRRRFPDVEFQFQTHLSQPDLFGRHEEKPDLAVALRFPCAEWDAGDLTKAEKCAVQELGLDGPFPEETPLPRPPRPLVGVHFLSTCLDSVSAKEAAARAVWETILEAGGQPIDTHFRHEHARASAWSWEGLNCSGCDATLDNLASVIAACRGFAGVSSGNFNMALSILPPERILFLRTNFPAAKLTRLPVRELDVRGGDIDRDALREWVVSLGIVRGG